VRDPETVSFLKAYVYRAARNLAIDRAKITSNRSRLNEFVRQELPETTPSPEPLLMQQERFEILERAIEALRPTRRMILVLRLWEELPYADIVARLASQGVMLNERTLNRWYAEALKELRQALLDAEELKTERLRREGRR
jgi:RNA polymerase sigma factor (sigma-70 family)